MQNIAFLVGRLWFSHITGGRHNEDYAAKTNFYALISKLGAGFIVSIFALLIMLTSIIFVIYTSSNFQIAIILVVIYVGVLFAFVKNQTNKALLIEAKLQGNLVEAQVINVRKNFFVTFDNVRARSKIKYLFDGQYYQVDLSYTLYENNPISHQTVLVYVNSYSPDQPFLP